MRPAPSPVHLNPRRVHQVRAIKAAVVGTLCLSLVAVATYFAAGPLDLLTGAAAHTVVYGATGAGDATRLVFDEAAVGTGAAEEAALGAQRGDGAVTDQADAEVDVVTDEATGVLTDRPREGEAADSSGSVVKEKHTGPAPDDGTGEGEGEGAEEPAAAPVEEEPAPVPAHARAPTPAAAAADPVADTHAARLAAATAAAAAASAAVAAAAPNPIAAPVAAPDPAAAAPTPIPIPATATAAAPDPTPIPTPTPAAAVKLNPFTSAPLPPPDFDNLDVVRRLAK